MSLKLKDLEFEVDWAMLGAYVPDPAWMTKYDPADPQSLRWTLDIQVKAMKVAGESWTPYIYHSDIYLPVRRWHDVAGQSIAWNSPYNETTRKFNDGFYVLEHEEITSATLRFLERDGIHFRVLWDGLCNVFSDDEYRDNVPFSVDTWVELTELSVDGSGTESDQTLRDRFAQVMEVEHLIEQPMKIEGENADGTAVKRKIFTPRSM